MHYKSINRDTLLLIIHVRSRNAQNMKNSRNPRNSCYLQFLRHLNVFYLFVYLFEIDKCRFNEPEYQILQLILINSSHPLIYIYLHL